MSRMRPISPAVALVHAPIAFAAFAALCTLSGCKSQPQSLGNASTARPAYDESGAGPASGPIASAPIASASPSNPYSRSAAVLGDAPGAGASTPAGSSAGSAQPRSLPAARPAARAGSPLQLGEAAPAQPVKSPGSPTLAGSALGGSAPLPAGGARTYVVQKGDTLWAIAKRNYGSGMKHRDILAANPGLQPDHIRVGQTLQLP